jgi:hypothetical protein
MLKTTYWAVPCRTCGGWIALAPVESDGQGNRVEHPVEQTEVIEETCVLCGIKGGYATHEINLWEGPAAVATWKPNPAFVRSSTRRVLV